jgi:hypothetical protein
MQNRATLRNAPRKQNYELPGVSHDMQRSERLHNSLGLNYKSAALPAELCRRYPYKSRFQRVDQEFVMTHFAHRAAKGTKFSRYFSTA